MKNLTSYIDRLLAAIKGLPEEFQASLWHRYFFPDNYADAPVSGASLEYRVKLLEDAKVRDVVAVEGRLREVESRLEALERRAEQETAQAKITLEDWVEANYSATYRPLSDAEAKSFLGKPNASSQPDRLRCFHCSRPFAAGDAVVADFADGYGPHSPRDPKTPMSLWHAACHDSWKDLVTKSRRK